MTESLSGTKMQSGRRRRKHEKKLSGKRAWVCWVGNLTRKTGFVGSLLGSDDDEKLMVF